MKKHIQAGTLNMEFTEGFSRLDELMAFASRENQKRGFLFVSKVLGKHIPVEPKNMRAIYDELADKCELHSGERAFVIGMAETATGLGAGVADSLARQNAKADVYYQHTTRHHLDTDIWFTLDEAHSHAVDHIMYLPPADLVSEIKQTQRLILVDDEVTTGRTLLLLAKRFIEKVPSIKKIEIITLASWLSEDALAAFDELGCEVCFIQLLKGDVSFDANPEFKASLPKNVDADLNYQDSRQDLGRRAMKMPYHLTDADLLSIQQDIDDGITVVGLGEHLYYPFLLAEKLAEQGPTLFQSTTRSPILKGDAIERKVCFDPGNGKDNFIYNLPKQPVLLCRELDSVFSAKGQICPAQVEV